MTEALAFALKARRHLARRDAVLKRVIAAIGKCALTPNPDGFGMLVRSIIAQQISTKAALSIHGRLVATLAASGVTPVAILQADETALRAAGLSAGKVRSLRDLAEKVDNRTVPMADLAQMPDEEVIAALVPVRGIGRWTAQMFLIFSLGRPDVLPVDDLGLRTGVKRQYDMEELPARDVLAELAEPWKPYRTIGTWYMWRSVAPVPQPKPQPQRSEPEA